MRSISDGKRHFASGIAAVLMFCACVLLCAIGVTITTTPTPRPAALGWLYLTLGMALAVRTAVVWERVLPGVFACGALNAVLIQSAGHIRPEARTGLRTL